VPSCASLSLDEATGLAHRIGLLSNLAFGERLSTIHNLPPRGSYEVLCLIFNDEKKLDAMPKGIEARPERRHPGGLEDPASAHRENRGATDHGVNQQ
jgi:hypothetical protein